MLRLAKEYTFDILDYISIFIGTFLVSLAFQVYLLPNNIISGGVSGLSIVANAMFGVEPAIFQFALNIPLLIICYIFFGRAAGNKTLLGSILGPLFIQLMSTMEPWTFDPLLATVFGGAITGVGLGIVYRAKASTGGTAVIAQLLNKYGALSLGTSTMIVDSLVIISGMLVFSPEIAMYSIIALFVMSKFIDVIQIGFSSQKNVFIISEKEEEIRKAILDNISRGVTNIGVRGSFNKKDKNMLMIVIQEREFPFLKDVILDVDEEAFVVVTSASEVLGRGFSLTKMPYSPLEEEVNRD